MRPIFPFAYFLRQYNPCTVRNLRPGSIKEWCTCGLTKKGPWYETHGLLVQLSINARASFSYSNRLFLKVRWQITQRHIFQTTPLEGPRWQACPNYVQHLRLPLHNTPTVRLPCWFVPMSQYTVFITNRVVLGIASFCRFCDGIRKSISPHLLMLSMLSHASRRRASNANDF